MSSEVQSHSPDHSTSLVWFVAQVTQPMREHLARLLVDARPLLGRDVSQRVLLRAAMSFWLPRAELKSSEIVAAIGAANKSGHGEGLHRHPSRPRLVPVCLRVARAVRERLDRLARELSPLEGLPVSRSTLVRAALTTWFPCVDLASPAFVETLRAALLAPPHPAPTAETPHRCYVDLTSTLLARVDAFARRAGALLGDEVSRAAIVRAVVPPWLDHAEGLDVQARIVHLRRVAPAGDTPLHRIKLVWPTAFHLRFERFGATLGWDLFGTARRTRSALVSVALVSWLDKAERQPRAVLVALRAALQKRGRKAKR